MAQSGGFKHGTWEDLFAHIALGDYATEYAVGETLPFKIGNYDYEAQIAGFDKDTISDSTDKAPVTFVCKHLYITSKRLNPGLDGTTEGTGTIGGWEKMELRTYLSETIFPLVPDIVKNRIVSVKKYTKGYNTSGSAVNNALSNDKLWIPSYLEVSNTGGVEIIGTQTYPLFNFGANDQPASRRKTKPNSTVNLKWWTRSAYSTKNCYAVAINGFSASTNQVSSSQGIAIGFCIA